MTTSTAMTSTSTFPDAWDAIEADGPPFQFDPMHFPFPVSPLMASTSGAFEQGHLAAFTELGMPIVAHQVRHVNHYRYERTVPRAPANDQEAAQQAATAEATVQREIDRMLDRWYIEHRPRLVALHERLRQMQPREASRIELLALLDEVDDIHRDLWTIHFRIVVPMLLSMQVFSEYHADLFGEDADAHTLMAGSLSESIKAAFGLADLAVRARELGLDALIVATGDDALVPALEVSEHGQAFLAGLQAYLETYGYRQDLFDYTTATWLENPTIALAAVRNFLRSGHDPRAEHEAVARSAQQAFEVARLRLAVYPTAVWEQFELMVQHARQGAFLQEEHNFYIDQKGLALLRLFYLETGYHLRDRGAIAEADDVFMLRIEEIRALLTEDGSRLVADRTRALVAQRRDELERAAVLTPPPAIGDVASTAPPPDTAMMRAVTAFFGGPPQEAEMPGQLKGNPGSRGVVSGIARVARTLEEATAVQPGEILVALTTMPAWTPLFGIAAAVVTETGGALSHCAIVAREYGIPAVVGAHGATRAIATGQRVTVDGDRGLVVIEA